MFYVGQKVVCRKMYEFATSKPRGLELGKIYTVTKIGNCHCGKEVLYLEEAIPMKRWCGFLDVYTGFHASFYSDRFEPLVGSWVEELLSKISEDSECVVSS